MSDWLNETEDKPETEQNLAADGADEAIQDREDGYEAVNGEGEYEDAYEPEYEDEYEEAGRGQPKSEEAEYEDDSDDEPDYGAETDPEEETEEPDESKYIMTLLDYLTEALSKPISNGFMSKPRIDVDGCLDIVENIRQNIPASLAYCARTASEKERILENAGKIAENKVEAAINRAVKTKNDAKKEAERIKAEGRKEADAIVARAKEQEKTIIEEARARAARLVGSSEITKAAQKEAQEIKAKARRDGNDMRRRAVEDSWKLLDSVSKQIEGYLLAVNKRRDELIPREEE